MHININYTQCNILNDIEVRNERVGIHRNKNHPVSINLLDRKVELFYCSLLQTHIKTYTLISFNYYF